MGISLCFFMKNEENCVGHMIESVRDFVDEIVCIDTGSSDRSIEIVKAYGARIYQVAGLNNFGETRTLACHLAKQDWILTLDCDETLTDPYVLKVLMELKHEAYSLPRKRWLDLEMTQQTELDAYPDRQVRFFKNNTNYVFRRALHEYFDGAEVHPVSHPVINHLHDYFKDFNRKQERLELYGRLSRVANVSLEGGHKL